MVTVIKQNHLGEKLLEYSGEVLMQGKTWVCIEATYNNPDKDAGYVVFRRGDTFIEWYYSDRWYNVFELYDVDDGQHKGWYCNITRPAIISEDTDSVPTIWRSTCLFRRTGEITGAGRRRVRGAEFAAERAARGACRRPGDLARGVKRRLAVRGKVVNAGVAKRTAYASLSGRTSSTGTSRHSIT